MITQPDKAISHFFLQPRRVQGRNQTQAELPVVLAPASPLLADVVFDRERLARLVVAEHSYCAHVQVEFSGGSQADNQFKFT